MQGFELLKMCYEELEEDKQKRLLRQAVRLVKSEAVTAAKTQTKEATKNDATIIGVSEASKAEPKKKTRKRRTSRPQKIVVNNVEYASLASFCRENDLERTKVYPKFSKAKNPRAAQKYLADVLAESKSKSK
jgi:hypothetical protein